MIKSIFLQTNLKTTLQYRKKYCVFPRQFYFCEPLIIKNIMEENGLTKVNFSVAKQVPVELS
jgi:hypothetical protein